MSNAIEPGTKSGRLGRVAVVGRPNVGKSTLFNILTGTRKAVVKDLPGVTRDIQAERAEWRSIPFEVIDTGGVTEGDVPFSEMIRHNVEGLLNQVDLIVMVVDGRTGLHPEDADVMRIVRKARKPFLIVVNKVDKRADVETAKYEFYELGDEIITASFEQRRGVDDLLEWIVSHFEDAPEAAKGEVTIAVLGKPNAGKSSLCNRIAGEERMLVSEIAGTTVDAIDLQIEFRGKRYTMIDTAGLRRQARREDGVEFLSAYKSFDALRRADIVLLMVDSLIGPTDQDAKIVEKIIEQHKGVILVASKSDLAAKEIPAYRETFRNQVERELHFFPDIPVVFVSSKTGAGIEELFNQIDEVWRKLHFRISTSKLNDFFTRVIRQAPAPVWGTQNVSFYYLTQTKQVPPSFIAFANFPEGVTPAYRRFLSKKIKEEWSLEGIPIRIFAMKSGRAPEREHDEP
ncbi:MAG TPA: ribosome biogenesis GTPase Der [Bdellovibrionales bacterium]|nr:ribosome biogenesis GTPase Der [Bdellovibrionales bacterium]